MENRYKVTLDLKQRVLSNIKFKQGDTDSSVLEINLTDNGLPVDITGQTIVFNFNKQDGTVVTQNSGTGVSILNASTGNFQCVLKSQTLAAPGEVQCEIQFSNNGVLLTTATFKFIVDSSIGSGTISANYISQIEQEVINLQNTFDGNELARTNTFNINETSRQNTFNTNETTRQTNENTRITNENARVLSENARVSEWSTWKNQNTMMNDLYVRQAVLIPVKTALTVSRAGLAINPLTQYSPTSLTSVTNNVFVDNAMAKDNLCYFGRNQIRNSDSIIFKTINEYTLNGSETM